MNVDRIAIELMPTNASNPHRRPPIRGPAGRLLCGAVRDRRRLHAVFPGLAAGHRPRAGADRPDYGGPNARAAAGGPPDHRLGRAARRLARRHRLHGRSHLRWAAAAGQYAQRNRHCRRAVAGLVAVDGDRAADRRLRPAGRRLVSAELWSDQALGIGRLYRGSACCGPGRKPRRRDQPDLDHRRDCRACGAVELRAHAVRVPPRPAHCRSRSRRRCCARRRSSP